MRLGHPTAERVADPRPLALRSRRMADESTRRNLVMILARDLTSRLVTPCFVVDADGTLAFFNEAAETVLGRTYAESGELQAGEWASEWAPTDLDGNPVPLEELPLGIAFREGRAAHRALCITAVDGIAREIEVTAFPLCAREGHVEGAIAVFWERPGRPSD
jgi:PAS domain-containing protein